MKWLVYTMLVLCCAVSSLPAQEKIPFMFGDMDHWVVREIHESAIIGGQTKYLYELGPVDTIVGNTAYKNRGNSPWANSNVMAKVAGIVKTNVSVFPEKRGEGWCARMETRMEKVNVLGLVDIEVVAAGSIFLGSVHEPIKGTKNPQSMLLSGLPFTKRPKVLQFGYKVKVMPQHTRVRSTGSGRTGFCRCDFASPETLGGQAGQCLFQAGRYNGTSFLSIKQWLGQCAFIPYPVRQYQQIAGIQALYAYSGRRAVYDEQQRGECPYSGSRLGESR